MKKLATLTAMAFLLSTALTFAQPSGTDDQTSTTKTTKTTKKEKKSKKTTSKKTTAAATEAQK